MSDDDMDMGGMGGMGDMGGMGGMGDMGGMGGMGDMGGMGGGHDDMPVDDYHYVADAKEGEKQNVTKDKKVKKECLVAGTGYKRPKKEKGTRLLAHVHGAVAVKGEEVKKEAPKYDLADAKVGDKQDVTADGGVKKECLVEGTGEIRPPQGAKVIVHYVGTLEKDGSKFDSSRDRDSPFDFKLGTGGVIKGWDAGVATMRKGEKSILTCTSDYAYGDAGSGEKIPGGATLTFEVELLSWESDDEGPEYVFTEGAVIESTRGGEAKWVDFSDAGWAKGVAKGVETMRRGEKSVFTIDPEYGLTEGEHAGAWLKYEVELAQWEEEEDVSPNYCKDGSVMKTIKVEGPEDNWDKPTYESPCTADIVGTVAGADAPFFSEEGVKFVIGEETAPAGAEVCVESMKTGEEAAFTVQPKRAYGDDGCSALSIPAGAVLQYKIKLVSFDKVPSKWDIKGQEKLDAGKLRREQGNELYKAKKFTQAKRKYEKAVELLEDDYDLEEDLKKEAKKMRTPCLTNLAAVQLTLNEYPEVIKNCGKVLEQEPENVKALLRRAKAHNATNDWDSARTDLNRLLDDLDKDNADAKKEMAKLQKKIKAHDAKERALFGGMFAKMAKMQRREEPRSPKVEAGAAAGEEAAEPASAP